MFYLNGNTGFHMNITVSSHPYTHTHTHTHTHTLLIIFRNISPPTDLEPKSKYTFISGSRGGLNLLE